MSGTRLRLSIGRSLPTLDCTPCGGSFGLVHPLLWLLLALLVLVGIAVVSRLVQQRTARERARLWNPETEGAKAVSWDDSLGVGPVRPLTEDAQDASEDMTTVPVSSPREDPPPVASSRPPDDPTDLGTEAEAPAPESPEPPPADVPPLEMPDDRTPHEARAHPAWWQDDAPGAGALLHSLVERIGGSAALLRPDPSDEGYLVLAAAGATADTLYASPTRTRFRADALTDIARDPVSVVLTSEASGLLPGSASVDIGETAVRTLAPPPAHRRLLVVDVPADHPLDAHSERLLNRYADLLADLLGLPTEPAPLAVEHDLPDPLVSAMEMVASEIDTSRETGRAMAFALVVPYDQHEMTDAEAESMAEHEAALHERIAATPGTLAVEPMGPLVFGVVCDAEPGRPEHWARTLATDGPSLRIGMAVYGPRHVTPDRLRQDAAHALHQTYVGDDTCVILE